MHQLNTVYQFWIHTKCVGRLPAPVEWLFNTPSHHRVHHDRRVHKNYAAIFMVWDRCAAALPPLPPPHMLIIYSNTTANVFFPSPLIPHYRGEQIVRDVRRRGRRRLLRRARERRLRLHAAAALLKRPACAFPPPLAFPPPCPNTPPFPYRLSSHTSRACSPEHGYSASGAAC